MPQNITTGIKAFILEANETAPTKSVDGVKNLYKDKIYVLIDLHDTLEFKKENKIPGSFCCPRGMLEFWIDPESLYTEEIFNQNKTHIFYCDSAWR